MGIEIVIVFLPIILGVVFLIKWTEKNNKIISEKQKELDGIIGGTYLDRFFIECVLAEANDFSKQKNIQRAELLAKKYGLSYPNGIKALYERGMNAHAVLSKNTIDSITKENLDKLSAKETEEYKNLITYSHLSGKEKRKTMLKDEADACRKYAKDCRDGAKWLMNSGLESERDWATWGGIADGLAGVGAGISVANDIQRQNEQIKINNAAHIRRVTPQVNDMKSAASNNEIEAKRLMEEYNKMDTKLISDESASSLVKKISFSNTSVTISETGTATVVTGASIENNFMIFDDVPAVIDGTILADICDGSGHVCGTAMLVLPVDGLRKNVSLRGMCLKCCNPKNKYTVRFKAENLWAMER